MCVYVYKVKKAYRAANVAVGKWQRSPVRAIVVPSDLLSRVQRPCLPLHRSKVCDSCLCEDIVRTQHPAD